MSDIFRIIQATELTEVVTKGTTPTTLGKDFVSDGILFLRVQNIRNGKIVKNNDDLYIDDETNKILKRSVIKPNDVLVSIAGTIGRSAIVPNDAPPLNCNQAVAIVRLKSDEILPEYFQLWLDTPDAQRQMMGAKVTGTISNLSLTQIKNLQIPVPSLEHQKFIADVLDKATQLKSKRQISISKLNDLVDSLFLSMFGIPALNSKNWEMVPAKSIIKDIVGGVSHGGETRELLPDELGVLKISAVTTGVFNPKAFKAIKKSDIKKDIVQPKKGDLLFSRANTREMVGATCIVDQDYDYLFLPDKLWRIDLDSSQCINWYFKTLLSNDDFRGTLTKMATGTSGSMLNISKAKLMSLPIPLPPIELQRKFEIALGNISKNKINLEKSLYAIDNLFNSLQQKAFKGELIPSDLKKLESLNS